MGGGGGFGWSGGPGLGFSGDPNLWGKGGLEIVKGGLHSDRVVPKRAMGQEVTILGTLLWFKRIPTGPWTLDTPPISALWCPICGCMDMARRPSFATRFDFIVVLAVLRIPCPDHKSNIKQSKSWKTSMFIISQLNYIWSVLKTSISIVACAKENTYSMPYSIFMHFCYLPLNLCVCVGVCVFCFVCVWECVRVVFFVGGSMYVCVFVYFVYVCVCVCV